MRTEVVVAGAVGLAGAVGAAAWLLADGPAHSAEDSRNDTVQPEVRSDESGPLTVVSSDPIGPYFDPVPIPIDPSEIPAAVAEVAPMPPPAAAEAAPPSAATEAPAPRDLTPNQMTDGVTLSPGQGWSACGPAAATAFARSALRPDFTLDESFNVAVANGRWAGGMKGYPSEVALLADLGIPAHFEDGVDFDRVNAELDAGRPVIVCTPAHYLVIEQRDPATGLYDFGNSATAFEASVGSLWGEPDTPRKRWYSPEQIPELGSRIAAVYSYGAWAGQPVGTIYMDTAT